MAVYWEWGGGGGSGINLDTGANEPDASESFSSENEFPLSSPSPSSHHHKQNIFLLKREVGLFSGDYSTLNGSEHEQLYVLSSTYCTNSKIHHVA